jgi:hypothetical protein
MCFSAQASFTAAGVLALASIVAFKLVKTKKQNLLAAIPALFAIQQATEGTLWLSFAYNNVSLQTISTYIFLFFALIFWPLWAPFTLWTLEPNDQRKNLLWIPCIAGILCALSGIFHLLLYGATAQVTVTHHIAYNFHLASWLTIPSLLCYLLATVIPFFISSIPYFWIGGILLFLGYLMSWFFYIEALGSVWCYSAALFSVLICVMLYNMNKERQKDDSWYWRRLR